MTHIVVADWDRTTNKIIAENRAASAQEAEVMRVGMVSDGYVDAFVAELPAVYGSGWGYIDPVAKTVLFDSAKSNAASALAGWGEQMAATDKDIPRSTEDIYDALDEDAQGRVAQIVRDRIAAKKTLRGEKP